MCVPLLRRRSVAKRWAWKKGGRRERAKLKPANEQTAVGNKGGNGEEEGLHTHINWCEDRLSPLPPPLCFSPPARAFLFPPPFCGALVRYYSTTPPSPLYPSLSRSGRTRWAPIRGCCDCSRELRSSVRRSGRRPFEKRRPFQLVALCAYPSPLYLHPCFVLLLPRLLLLHRPRLPVRPSVRRKATATLPPPPLRPELLLLDFVPLPPLSPKNPPFFSRPSVIY